MQTTVHKIGTLGLATATVLGLTAFQYAEAASLYTVTDLGTLSGRENLIHNPIGINNAGQIFGRSGLLPIDGDTRAFLWENGEMTDIGTLGGLNREAFDINESGQIVGYSEINPFNPFDYHAFLWENGEMTDLGTLGTANSQANGINNIGQVVGQIGGSAVLWENGEIIELGTLGGSANEINDSGQIVGDARTSSGNRRAFLWENGTMIDLGTLGGSDSTASIAEDINESGQVVGYAALQGGSIFNVNRHAFLWQDGTMTDLGTLDNLPVSEAFSINNAGQVVGWATDGGFSKNKAFLWENGVMLDLDNLIPTNSGWELQFATGINDVGQIVGVGLRNEQLRGFLLTPESDPAPVPEPLTLLGSATALGFGTLFKREYSKRQKKVKPND
jgi:probable HAF family extracellular repeat protein